MADQQRGNEADNLRDIDLIENNPQSQYGTMNNNLEETSAEIAAPVTLDRGNANEGQMATANTGTGVGYAALIMSILSLFFLPVLFGAVGIVLGFVARRRGAEGLGAWAIGIGAVSIIIGMFILPFF